MANFAIVTCILTSILCNSWLKHANAQPQRGQSSWEMLENLRKAVENLHTKIDMQTTTLNNLQAKVEMQATSINSVVTEDQLQTILLNNLVTKSETQALLLNNLVTKEDMQARLDDLATKEELQATLINNLKAKADLQMTSLNNLGAKEEMQANSLNKLEVKIDIQKTLLSDVVTKEEMEATSLKILEAQSEMQATFLNNTEGNADKLVTLLNNSHSLSSELQTLRTEVAILSYDFHNSRQSKGIVEGIIAGAQNGVLVISLGSLKQQIITSGVVTGVAFDWISRKVCWVESFVRINRANLDGTAKEVLISDKPEIWGLALDPITGNFYYGNRSSKGEINVCDRSAKKCAVVISGAGTAFDIALNPSKGIMFWSNTGTPKCVMRANMDGTNATAMISETIYGLDADLISNRLYSVNEGNRAIATYNADGSVRETLFNVVVPPTDVAVDGDTVYFSDFDGRSVYSVAPGGILSFVAKTTGKVRHIALYGRNKVHSLPNPCEHSPCSNVCVLKRQSFTCL